MRISDWSSDVCSSDLFQVVGNAELRNQGIPGRGHPARYGRPPLSLNLRYLVTCRGATDDQDESDLNAQIVLGDAMRVLHDHAALTESLTIRRPAAGPGGDPILDPSLRGEFEQAKVPLFPRSEEHTSELQTLMRRSYAVFSLKKKKQQQEKSIESDKL